MRTPSPTRRPAPVLQIAPGNPRRLLVALLLATAAFRMTQNMAMTTLSLLGSEAVHLGAGAIGVLGAVTGLTVAVVTLFLSRRVPHHRAAASAAAGMVALTGSLLMLAVAPSSGVLAAGAVLLGTAGGVVMPGLLNAIVSGAGAQRERLIAIYTVTLSVSLAVGPVLETVVLDVAHQAVRTPYLAFAVVPVLGAVLIALAGRRGPPAGRRHAVLSGAATDLGAGEARDRDGPTVEALDGDLPAFAVDTVGDIAPEPSRPPGDTVRRGWRAGLLATGSGRSALVAQLLYGVPFAGITVFGALVAHVGYGVSPARAQLAFTAFFILSLGARAAVAWRAPIAHKHALLWLSAALTAGGLLLLGAGHGPLALFVAMGLLGVPHGLTFPIALAMVADATPVADLPRANATLLGSTSLVSVVVPVVLGAVIPAVGYRGMTLVMLIPVAVFGFLQLALRSRPVAPHVPDPEIGGRLASGQPTVGTEDSERSQRLHAPTVGGGG